MREASFVHNHQVSPRNASCFEGLSLTYGCRGRPQRQMRVVLPDGKPAKRSFHSYHLTWLAKFGLKDMDISTKQYSHRCHQLACINPHHGCWETSSGNNCRNCCLKHGSHLLVVPHNSQIVRVCTHDPVCLNQVVIEDLNDPRFLRYLRLVGILKDGVEETPDVEELIE